MARQSGVEMDFLDVMDDSPEETPMWGAKKSGMSRLEELEDDLEQEFDEQFGSNFQVASVLTKDKQTGKLVSREQSRGIRVGSAGGWSLEVFPGDFVVHRKYGIGRYDQAIVRPKTKLTEEEKAAQRQRRLEITKEWLKNEKNGRCAPEEIREFQTRFGTKNDTDPISNPQTTVLEIAYDDGTVHVPIDRAYRLSRFRAGDSPLKPKKLSKVRGEQWRNAKKKVAENTLQLAQDVLALYATRETLQRDPFDPALEDKAVEFGDTFPYTPTPDQYACFDAVTNDMVWKSRPMDRLICGDVGFGKTEVALRAIYRCILNGRQAAFLAPTGVLAAQHYKNTVGRMVQMGLSEDCVGLLRGGMGKTSKNGKILREKIQNGTSQVIIGTHALLGKDVKFNNLGLLVIDEEQRFGVKQKERLKMIAEGVDVLTMSATPIPRTLQMSLSGIRDTSTLQSPPPMRKPTATVVEEISDELILQAIGRELDRGGQCYYVVPRISMMDDAEERIVRLFPNITIVSAHGRMGKNQAEQHVADFAEGNGQVLLATTVIENGVDIPSVNTIIIQNAQNFGMSTLYQLRGRVGRSDKQAYAYFLHSGEAFVSEQAGLRLQAIADLTSLGSGLDVANRDLEIRGAGSLLGTEQSGMAAKVGFDLYMRMLKKSIRQLKGLDIPFVSRTNLLVPELSLNNFTIPASFIKNDTLRYQEETQARLAESTAHLVNITNAWKQEYGTKLPASLQANLKKLHLQACCRRLGIDVVGLLNGEDLYLRSPGLRPRHMKQIVKLLGKKTPRGFQVVFPSRMMNRNADDEDDVSMDEQEKDNKYDLKSLLSDRTMEDYESNYREQQADIDGDDDEDWDAVDKEEANALKDIASAMQITKLTPDILDDKPHFVLANFTSSTDPLTTVLQPLLPLSKIVYEQQENDKRQAQLATELREKRNLVKEKQKAMRKINDKRMGFAVEMDGTLSNYNDLLGNQ